MEEEQLRLLEELGKQLGVDLTQDEIAAVVGMAAHGVAPEVIAMLMKKLKEKQNKILAETQSHRGILQDQRATPISFNSTFPWSVRPAAFEPSQIPRIPVMRFDEF